jgi:hypothetical protein
MSHEIRSSGNIVKLSQSSTPLSPIPRALLCGTAGTFTGKDATGQTLTDLPLQQGYNPISISVWSGGAATDVWALY